jgi:hypothetical protein
MISLRLKDRLRSLGFCAFFAALGLFCAWRTWSALSTGQINTDGGARIVERTQHPMSYWFETGLSAFGAILFLGGVVAATIYKLAGPLGWRKLTPIERLEARGPPMDDARRRSLRNEDL